MSILNAVKIRND